MICVDRTRTWFLVNTTNAAIADTKKSVLKTIAAMDLDKINMDLVENLLEWIIDGKHDYPPGRKPAEPRARCFVADAVLRF